MSSESDLKAIENFRNYLRIKTVHPNPDYDGCVKFLIGMAEELGLKHEIIEYKFGIPIFLMTLKGQDESLKSILLSSHYDVVPVSSEFWESDPFAAEVRPNGDIVARGAQDMKCVGMAYLEAIRRLKSNGLKRTIHLVFTPDEEIGSENGAAKFVHSEKFKELNIGICLDEGLPSPSEKIYIFNCERSTTCINIVSSGVAGHGSSLPQGTAVERLLLVLNKFSEWRREESSKLVKLNGDLGSVNSINITMLNTGKQHNVIPETAEATVDIRISPNFSLKELEDKINDFTNINGIKWNFSLKHDSSTISSIDPANPYWSSIHQAIIESNVEYEIKVFPGGTDSRFYRSFGLPAYGISPFRNTTILLHDHNEFLNSKVNSLSVKDNRTGIEHEIKILAGPSVRATDFQNIKDETAEGIKVFDPAYGNTAVVESSICYIDGDKGILEYRGYPIEELAEKSTFLEVAYLLIYGELPTTEQYVDWKEKVMKHTFVHTRMTQLMKNFNHDAHPMGMFISSMAAISTFHPEANPALHGADLYIKDEKLMNKQIVRILGKAPTIAAANYRHRIGRPFNLPRNDLDYAENFLYMMDRLSENEFKSNPVLTRALDVMFILHADHEMNCSTAAMRHIGSSRVDPYSAVAGASAALYGPLHGGANEAVLDMLIEIGSVENVQSFLESVKNKDKKLMGFGHRVYRNYDPRAKIIRTVAYQVFEVCGQEPLIEVAIALEKAALEDSYFVERKLYPNVDFYSGLIYRAMGFPTDFFPVLFAIPRVTGWLAHWRESLHEKNPKIWRPRQIYTGEPRRPYVSIYERSEDKSKKDSKSGHVPINVHPYNRRYTIAMKSRI